MSTSTTTLGLAELVEKTISKDSDRYKVKTKIRSALQELNFNKKRLKLQVSDPSYKLRYQYALEFWREKTGNEKIAMALAHDLIDELKEKLNSKDHIYPEAEENNEILDGFFSQETPTKGKHTKKQSSVDEKPAVNYVTTKCENKFYVKSTNICEAEIGINTKEFLKCIHKLICPGDEVNLVIPSGCFGDKWSVQITNPSDSLLLTFLLKPVNCVIRTRNATTL
ncbi:Hypothetical predicted protein [Paramuricea clavata]|uniref:Uncharacterized protein n=1 Tax=Paramuricea clavata TaxID=317549 RepID=A0A7D9IQ47_PARCT|nr:Hypothetical predicted protein [Paramuricea clavata]